MATRTARAPETTDGCCGPLLAEPLDEAHADELASQFAALADPVRLRLLSLIASAGEVCSCDLQEPLGKSQPTISHHTRVLVEAGLIVGEKRGRWVWWRVVPAELDRLRATLR
ncbi:MAG TPA: metalloregulator ArsR/SmtB family transcription factor [Microthrixaceae bacterium]|nr:metalloregulator ArsR/SmtB family transcription factor [Microthrixaceae bacterium]